MTIFHYWEISCYFTSADKINEPLTNVHERRGRHVAHGRWEEEKGVKALAWVHLGLWASSVMAKQEVEHHEAAQLTQKHTHRLVETHIQEKGITCLFKQQMRKSNLLI